MRKLLILAFLSLTAPARADIAADTDFVVMKQMEATGDAQRWDALSDQAIAKFEPAIENLGATILDRAAFKEVLLADTYDELLDTIRSRWILQYRTHLTPDEITALADFYRRSSGKALEATISETGALPAASNDLLNGPLEPLLEHFPKMQASFSDLEKQIKGEMANAHTLEGVAQILAMKDIIGFETEARQQEVIEAFQAHYNN